MFCQPNLCSDEAHFYSICLSQPSSIESVLSLFTKTIREVNSGDEHKLLVYNIRLFVCLVVCPVTSDDVH